MVQLVTALLHDTVSDSTAHGTVAAAQRTTGQVEAIRSAGTPLHLLFELVHKFMLSNRID